MEEQADFKTYLNGLELKGKESILSAIRHRRMRKARYALTVGLPTWSRTERSREQATSDTCAVIAIRASVPLLEQFFSRWKSPHGSHKSLGCLESKLTVRESAKRLDVNTKTAFAWRHKMLSALSSYAPKTLNGKVQCDETEIPQEPKGLPKQNRKPRKRGCDF